MKQELQDRIDDYMLNRMSDKERQAFEKEVNDDPELKNQLEFSMKVQQGINNRNEKLAAMRKWDKPSVPVRRVIYWASGVAAVFIAGLFVINIKSNHLVRDKEEIMLSSANSSKDNGVILYDERFPNIEAYESYEGIRGDVKYLEIEALLDDGQYEEALAVIEKEERELDESDSYELCWLKAKAFVGLGRKEEALELLDVLRQTECEYKQEADSLYRVVIEP